MRQKNLLLFLILSMAILFGSVELQRWLLPKKEKPSLSEVDAKKHFSSPGQLPWTGLLPAGEGKDPRKEAPAATSPEKLPPEKPKPARPSQVVALGDGPGPNAKFNLYVELDSKGAGVRQVVLNKFQEADKDGRPVFETRGGKRVPKSLVLVPYKENSPFSNLLYHYEDVDSRERPPSNALADTVWEVDVKRSEEEERATFKTEISGVELTKTFILKPDDYDIRLVVEMKLKEGKAKKFRYQLSSSHGLPVEGVWYTGTFRNAVVLKSDDKDRHARTLTTASEICANGGRGGSWQGQTGWSQHSPGAKIGFVGVAVQYFASVIAVDTVTTESGQKIQPDVLEAASPVIESARLVGTISDLDPAKGTLGLTVTESKWLGLSSTSQYFLFTVAPKSRAAKELEKWFKGQKVGVVYRKIADQYEATEIVSERDLEPVFVDDIIVRAMSRIVDLKENEPVVHKFLLYNGPNKVRLLRQLAGSKEVPAGIVDHYIDDLSLNELTDAPSPGAFGWIANKLYWTDLLIKCTNLMHSVLWLLHTYVMPASWGVCILLLTILVRGAMFPVSRKQAMTGMKMQQLAPELKKLKEKYKDDRQALGAAQMELYRKHGIDPFGSCWMLLLQMPIFLGLYYCLQESIHFRLEPFLWIENLAAPDMLFGPWPWMPHLPLIGGLLGPFFNILPIIAVALMIGQQSMLTPPPTDEQQAMQMKMMKYMMVFFGLLFFKVASGLCIYFIASSLWGFAERKLLPKRKAEGDGAPTEPVRPGLFQRLLAKQGGASTTAATPASASSMDSKTVSAEPRFSGKRKKRRRHRQGKAPMSAERTSSDRATSKVRSWWNNFLEWWEEIRKKASKK